MIENQTNKDRASHTALGFPKTLDFENELLGKVTFDTEFDVFDFLQKELPILRAIQQQNNQLYNSDENCVNALKVLNVLEKRNLLNEPEEGEVLVAFSNENLLDLILETYKGETPFPHSISQDGSVLLDIENKFNGSISRAFSHIILKGGNWNNGNVSGEQGAFLAMCNMYGVPMDDPANNKAQEEIFKEACSYKEQSKQALSDAKSYLEQQTKKLEELEDLYLKKLKLDGAASYWRGRGHDAHWGMVWWGIASAISCYFWVYFLHDVISKNIYKDGEIILIDFNYGLSLIVLVTLTIGAAILNVLVRNFMSAAHLRIKSTEKVTMIQTYLALTKDNPDIDPGTLQLLLTSIFEPDQTGLIGKSESHITPAIELAKKVRG